jgi:hypothetical protein
MRSFAFVSFAAAGAVRLLVLQTCSGDDVVSSDGQTDVVTSKPLT